MTKQERDELREYAIRQLEACGENHVYAVSPNQMLSLLDELDKKDEAYAQGFEDAKNLALSELALAFDETSRADEDIPDWKEDAYCLGTEDMFDNTLDRVKRIQPKGTK